MHSFSDFGQGIHGFGSHTKHEKHNWDNSQINYNDIGPGSFNFFSFFF